MKSLKLNTSNQFRELTIAQKGLYELLCKKLKSGESLTLEEVVICYSENMKDVMIYEKWCAEGKTELIEINVIKSFQEKNWYWTYHVRLRIMQWLITTIGVLVIKGALKIIPNLEIEE
jgi:predicted methyltransferase